jgi:hypothetical protein
MALVLAVVAAIIAATAGAVPRQTDVAFNLGASRNPNSGYGPSGGSVTVTSRNFYAIVDVSLISTTPGGSIRIAAELGGGLRWGADAPDPSENCTGTETTAACATRDLQPITGQSSDGWYWDVIAPANGTYTFSGRITGRSEIDPDPSNDSSSITIVVAEPGGGGSATVVASPAKLSPARPRAGSTVVASVRVTRGGSPVSTAEVACAASLGGTKVKGNAKAASGVASCAFKTPRNATGKRLAGSVSFRSGGQRFVKRFATRLR